MRINIHHHFAGDNPLFHRIMRELKKMSEHLNLLVAEVERNREVDNSIIELLEGLAAKLEDFKDDPAQIAALAAELRSSSDNVAAAVVRHTPADPDAGDPEE